MGVYKWLPVGFKKISKAETQRKPEKTNKKDTKWLKKAGFLETDDLKTIDYNKKINLDNVVTVDYYNDTHTLLI